MSGRATTAACSSIEIWFQARDDCLRATICDIATLAPGETYQLDANDCVGPDFQGSAWIRSTQVMGIGVDIIGGDVVCLMPTKDSPNNITAQVAMVMMFEILTLIALRKAA
mgnify:CR=1 FL=1